jgi:hypothetical protein
MGVSFVRTFRQTIGWLQRRHIRDKMGSLHCSWVEKSCFIVIPSRAREPSQLKENCDFSALLRLDGMT